MADQTFTTVNPATGETLEEYDAHDLSAVHTCIHRAWSTSEAWRTSPFSERASLLGAVAAELETRREELARLMTTEMGKPVAQARSEVDKCAWVCRYYAENAEAHLAADHIETDATRSYVRFDPLGPVLAIMPWNFPLWQVFRFAAPATMAGNVTVLKHASNVPGCALAIEDIFRTVGAAEGVFQTLLVDSEVAGEVIADARIRGVTLTGSVPAGRAVASTAGRQLKKTVLELGGSDPFLVLSDADLDRAAEVGARSRMINSGQSCIAAKRFIVEDDVADEFTEGLVTRIAELVVGDPLDNDTDIGPLARADLRDDLHGQVRRSLDAGASVALGGGPLDQPGFFYAPTVLTGVDDAMPAGDEETFGPAAAVIRVADHDEAIRTANRSNFGLGASLWTRDLELAERLAARIEAGNVFVNELVKSDPRVPFGGVKDSGYGRELGSYGIHEFVNAKTVWVA